MLLREALLNYGILGIWTLTLLWDKVKFQKKLEGVIENNTKALVRVEESLDHFGTQK